MKFKNKLLCFCNNNFQSKNKNFSFNSSCYFDFNNATSLSRDEYSLRFALQVLKNYTGYLDLPSGRPCGVLAYMWAHGKKKIDIPSSKGTNKFESIEVPFFDASSHCTPKIYYSFIKTNPLGLWLNTIPKGAQDLIAVKFNKEIRFELGQLRTLKENLLNLGVNTDKYTQNKTLNCLVNKMHIDLIIRLKQEGFHVRIEHPFEAAVRETKEEHGFDLNKSWDNVKKLNFYLGYSLSKRLKNIPIAHFIYLCEVLSFNDTILSHSFIVEEKNPLFYGRTYEEFGLYMTLSEIVEENNKIKSSKFIFDRNLLEQEIILMESKLEMLHKIEKYINGLPPTNKNFQLMT